MICGSNQEFYPPFLINQIYIYIYKHQSRYIHFKIGNSNEYRL